MIVTLSYIAEALVFAVGFVLLAIAAMWMIGEDLEADVDAMADERRRQRSAL